MKNLVIGFLLGSIVMAGLAFAGDYLGSNNSSYLHPSEVQSTLGEIRSREATETLQFLRQRALDEAVHNAGKAPCR